MKLLEFIFDVFATMILLILIMVLGFFEMIDEWEKHNNFYKRNNTIE